MKRSYLLTYLLTY